MTIARTVCPSLSQWLSRNYGQHAATLAGMASATGDWVVTMDEDGQQNPVNTGDMLDYAFSSSLQLVYAQPVHPPPHGWMRNFLSRSAKGISTRMLGNSALGRFNSFRLVDGEIARTLAAYCGNGVYLDVGLFWIAARIGHCPLRLRNELGRPSGYSYWKLFGHFWNLVLTTGTRPCYRRVMHGSWANAGAAYARLGGGIQRSRKTAFFGFRGSRYLTNEFCRADYVAQALGIPPYTLTSYLASKYFVFPNGAGAARRG